LDAAFQRALGLPRQENEQTGTGRLRQQVRGNRIPGGLEHGQVQRRGRVRHRRVRPHAGQAVGQREEDRVAAIALLAQQGHAQHGLVHLARHDLAEHQGLAPIILALVGRDPVAHVLAGRDRVAVQQLGLHPGTGNRFVVVALRHDLQKPVQAAEIAQRRQAVDPESEEIAGERGLRLGRGRRRGVGQQQPLRQLAHGRRAQRAGQPWQQPLHRVPLATPPEVGAEAAAIGIEGPDRIRVEVGQPADLDALDLRHGVGGIVGRFLLGVRQQQGRRQQHRLTRRLRGLAFLGPGARRPARSGPGPGNNAQHEPGDRAASGETFHRGSSSRLVSWVAVCPR
jgi:hypothetical protein